MAHRRAHVIVGLGFGDEGKGSTVDYLTRTTQAKLVVRYNGGAQAAHNVVTPDGVHHTFAQFGSGLLANPEQQTILSRHMVMHVGGLINESRALEKIGIKDPLDRLIVDDNALVITPYHQAMNQIREAMRGKMRHGSCGVGVGETVADADKDFCIRAKDLVNHDILVEKLTKIREAKSVNFGRMKLPDDALKPLSLFKDHSFIYHTADYFRAISKKLRIYPSHLIAKTIREIDGDVIFEGAQGTLIDETWGFHPHTTWSNCTSRNALEMLKREVEWGDEIVTYGVVRAYATRHGAGPFPTEDNQFARKLNDIDEHNKTHPWQGQFRVGWFDGVLTRYAVNANKGTINKLIVTNLDRLTPLFNVLICRQYICGDLEITNLPVLRSPPSLAETQALGERLTKEVRPIYRIVAPTDLVHAIEGEAGIRAAILSSGPTWRDKKEIAQ